MGRPLIVNVNVQGLGQRPGAWRLDEARPEALLTETHWTDIARAAERGTIDALFFADAPAVTDPRVRPLHVLDPISVLATIAAETEHVGLVATASTSFGDPFDVAEQFATLDLLSGGRVGWNVVTSHSDDAARNFGRLAMPGRAERYAAAAEFTEAVRRLWAAGATGERVVLDGEHVRLDGYFAVPPSPQGHPALLQAGGSPAGVALAAQHADAVYTVETVETDAIANRAALRRAAVDAGRGEDAVAVLPGLALVLGGTDAEARERYDLIESLGPDDQTRNALGYALGVDVGDLDLDAPIPDSVLDAEPDPETFAAPIAYRVSTVREIREHGGTLRDVLRRYGGYGQRFVVGGPERVADAIETWHRSGAADGVNLMFDAFPTALVHFVDHVVPVLRERGLMRHEYEEPTLRGRFGPGSVR